MKNNNPIFLSGLWRSGSTYIWSQFRENPETYCFYEPLNQGLGRLNKKRIGTYNPEVTKVNTHPVLEKPYFAEFEPLLKRRGVKKFKRRFAYDCFAMDEEEKDEALKKYINSLCNLAQTQNKIPVLGFNRVCFRLGWLKNSFGAPIVHIDRNAREIWNSYTRLANLGNYTYFLIWLTIIERNADHPLFAPLAVKLPLRGFPQKLYMKPKKFYREVLNDLSPEETYYMVFYLWYAAALHALSYADHIIDTNRADESGYAGQCARNIKLFSNLDINLSDLRAGKDLETVIDFAAVEKDVIDHFPVSSLGRFIIRHRVATRLHELKREKAELFKPFF